MSMPREEMSDFIGNGDIEGFVKRNLSRLDKGKLHIDTRIITTQNLLYISLSKRIPQVEPLLLKKKETLAAIVSEGKTMAKKIDVEIKELDTEIERLQNLNEDLKQNKEECEENSRNLRILKIKRQWAIERSANLYSRLAEIIRPLDAEIKELEKSHSKVNQTIKICRQIIENDKEKLKNLKDKKEGFTFSDMQLRHFARANESSQPKDNDQEFISRLGSSF